MSFSKNGSLVRELTGRVILVEVAQAKELSEAIKGEDKF